MIDWIKVRKEGRYKLVVVSKQDIEDYLLISKLPDARVVSTFDFPDNWTVCEVSYNPTCRAFSFVVMSPEFDTVPLGMMPETILADRHIVEITRKGIPSTTGSDLMASITEEEAARKALEACYEYWQIYTKRRCLEGEYNTAVIWLEDNCNGHMMCFTRGEHKQSLKDCISGFDNLDNPFSLE